MRVSKNFILQEFIDRDTYETFGVKCIWFIDPKVIEIAQLLRDKSKRAVTVNNWHSGGQYNLSGFRPPSTKIGAKLSQHRFGRGIDVKVEGMTPAQVHELIYKHEDEFKDTGLTTLEDLRLTKTWTHIDCRQTNKDNIFIIGL